MRTAASRHDRLRRSAGAHRAVRSRFGAASDDAAVRRVAEYYAPPAWARGAIAIEDAMFLYDMVRCLRPRRVVEVGVASGASAAILLRALADCGAPLLDEGGSPALHSFDLHPFCYFDRARPVGGAAAEMAPDLARGMALHVRKTAADAAEMFAAEPLSLAFIDADHRHPWPTADVLALLPALRPGAWVVLHDIELPEYARRHERAHGTIVDWHQSGAQRLFDAWPFEKLRGVEGAFNIGAIRIPDDRPVTRADLQRVIDTPWETTPNPRALRILGRDDPRA
jgi:predicted O-methyltransferase YrrM